MVTDYFIKWKGYGPESNSWVKESEMNADELIAEFEAEHIDTLIPRSRDCLLKEYKLWCEEDVNKDIWDDRYEGEARGMHQEDFPNDWSGP